MGQPREDTAGGRDRPYDDLYVYLLKGIVKENEEVGLSESFVGNWVEENNSFLFFSKPANQAVARLLRARSDLEILDQYHFTYDQWQSGSMKPSKVADFTITPTWEKTYDGEAGISIILDPGVVFGNGLHPTTRDCLKAICYTGRQRSFERVIDLGTGTGILALAAAHLGAKTVLAVDLNPLCVKTAKENVRRNNLGKIIRVVEGAAESFAEVPADLVIANIHYELIKRLLNIEGFLNRDRLVISGLMRSQVRELRGELGRHDFHILREWDHEMTWFTILAVKN
jgi:ribosomal protein L11 methyltransferase